MITSIDILKERIKGRNVRLSLHGNPEIEGECTDIFSDAGVDDGEWLVYTVRDRVHLGEVNTPDYDFTMQIEFLD